MKINSEYTFKILSPKMYNSGGELAKLLIEKGVITKAEFTKQLSTDRAVYQAMFKKVE